VYNGFSFSHSVSNEYLEELANNIHRFINEEIKLNKTNTRNGKIL